MLENKNMVYLFIYFSLAFVNHTHKADNGFLKYLRMDGSDMMTMTYVLEVKTSMKAAKLEFLTSML